MGIRTTLSTSAYKIVFVLSLFMLFFVSSISYKQLELLNSSEKLVRLSDRVNLELEQLISFVKDGETGQRGFIITGDSTYLQPYFDARVHINESFHELGYLTKSSPEQTENLAVITDLIRQRFAILETTLGYVHEPGVISDSLRKQLSKSRTVMFQIRKQADKMITSEADLLEIRKQQHKQNLFFTPLSALLISIFSLIVFVGSFIKINSDRKKMMQLSDQATQAKIITESERLYKHLIEGLPAALYTCDNEGYIELYNKAAVELWGREPQLGKDRWCGSWKLYRADGTELPAEASPMGIALKENRILDAEIIIERPDGSRKIIIAHPQSLFDAKGNRTGALNMLIDITDQKLSQKALEESEIRLRIATEGTKLATWDLNLVTREIVYSPRLNEIFGHQPSHQLTHQQMRDQVHFDDKSVVEEAFDTALSSGIYSYESRIDKGDGTTGWIKTEGKVLFDAGNVPVRMLGTMLDITEQKGVQEKILRSEKLFKSIALNIPNSLVLVFDTDYKILKLEGDIMSKMGYEPSDYEGKYLNEITPEERHNAVLPLYERVFSGETFSVERKSQETGDDFMMHFVPLKTDDGAIYASLIIALDITDFRKIQDRVAMFGAIVESSDDAIISKTLEGIITSWNNAATRIFGYTEEEMIGQPILKLIPEDRLDEEPRILEMIRTGRRVDHFETKRIAKDGRILDISLTLSPIKNTEGVIIGASKIARDVTSQKQAELLLKESEERFRTLADVAPVLLWMSGADKQYYFFNKGWLDFTGRTLKEESGNGWKEGVHPEDLERCLAIYTNAFDAREEFYMEYRLRRHDGEYRWISEKGIPRFAADGVFLGYIAGCMDIHAQKDFTIELERQVAERTNELREQKEFAETILDTSIDITIVYSRNMDFLSFNNAAEDKYGVSKEEILGKNLLSFYPESRDSKGHHDLMKALDGEAIHNKKYQSPITKLYYEDFLIPLKNRKGEVYAVLVIARDITDTIKNEELLIHLNESLTAKNTELERSNTELASFNHVASHDLQEPLRKIQTFISRIADNEQSALSEKAVDYFGKIQASANRMQKLIDDLLTFSRTNKADQQQETIDLNDTAELVLRELAQTIEETGAEIHIDKLPVLEGIAFQFQQLFTNLLGNALKYRKPGVAPSLRVECSRVKADQFELLNAPADKEYYKLTFSDKGIGFEPQYARQIFDLFQRLHGKTEYSGTGIGLTICKKIVENHGGKIIAEGKPGEGSVFTVFLPV